MILAGDVGGTKCNLAIFEASPGGEPVVELTLRSREFGSLEEVIEHFLAADEVSRCLDRVEAVCIGIAGPVVGGHVATPNLPWIVDIEDLRQLLKIDAVSIINDLVATGYGILALSDDQFETLNPGKPDPEGHFALIAAGTGLGEALLIRTPSRILPIPSEGGHCDFAPRNEEEIQLFRRLNQTWSHVSYERILSGPGLFAIYQFLRDADYALQAPGMEEKLAKASDPSVLISNMALSRECPLAVKSLDMFAAVYGAEAGNLALKSKAVGGVYVGGGIAPKILDKLRDGTFLEAFLDKGRLEPLMRMIPVQVVLNPKAALHGAAAQARSRLQ
jgi:glucokinase